YRNILVPVDNSKYSNYAVDASISLAGKFNSHLVGSHVYAARLHDKRFKQMEGVLPERYQNETVLRKQRVVHDSLITRGLQVISDSYLSAFQEKCADAGITGNGKILEGKNFVEIVNEVQTSSYDLVVLGALGLGAVETSMMGSTCERVLRRVRSDVLVVKKKSFPGKKILVALDGSSQSFAGLKVALRIGKYFDSQVDAVSAFDPDFHRYAFHNLSGVLSEKAKKVFKFQEQERLHEEIIDKGLAKIYQGYLNAARKIAEEEKVEIETTLLFGKAFDVIHKRLFEVDASLLVVGRFGVHNVDGLDIGSTAENLVRLSPCNVLVANGQFLVPEENLFQNGSRLLWSMEAELLLERIPAMARGMAKKAIEEYAKERGYREVTSDVMDEAKKKFGMTRDGKR
ncbi:MAG: universal stress protein, partial [Candidatus Hydrothermarchaeota archaeon]|nr:universal stress protein [Candidatus Hydrothermarchaeota archaeon]